MTKPEMEARCSDILEVIVMNQKSTCLAYGLDFSQQCGRARERLGKKEKEPSSSYKMYHDLQELLVEHNYVRENAYTWDKMEPLINELEALATTLALER